MNVYRNGEYIDTFRGVREFDLLTQFIAKYAEPRGEPEQLSEEPASHGQRILNREGMVQALNPTNFDEVIRSGPSFVKFFAPWYVLLYSTITRILRLLTSYIGVVIVKSLLRHGLNWLLT